MRRMQGPFLFDALMHPEVYTYARHVAVVVGFDSVVEDLKIGGGEGFIGGS